MRLSILITAASLGLVSALHAQGYKTTEESYLVPTANADFTFEPILTVGDLVPVTGGGATDKFAMCGIPDAMGFYRDTKTRQNILFMAHEMPSNVHSQPFANLPRYKGAWVSRFVMGSDGGVINGSIAHKDLYLGNTKVADHSPIEGETAAFTRFCSGSFIGTKQGFDRPIFFTNEESADGNYEAKGSQTVAVIDGALHTLPALGRVARENTIPMPRHDGLTVLISTEDGSNPSYVYMYVGQKDKNSTDVLARNGLVGGKTYVLASEGVQHNEGTFTKGDIKTKWVEIPNAASLTSAQLSEAADDAGAFGFVRVEDGECDPNEPTRYIYFSTTGGSGPNRLGRLYKLQFNKNRPWEQGELDIIYNADELITPGGTYAGAATGQLRGAGATGNLGNYTGGDINAGIDYPVSIDNIAINSKYIVICEDRNAPADAVFAKYGRTGGVWTLDMTKKYAAKLQATFNYGYVGARDNRTTPLSGGTWEASGVIETNEAFGSGTFAINVQGHSNMRTNAPDGQGGSLPIVEANRRFAEDGQLLIMRKAK